jgi:hypothetical protein
MDEPRRNDKAIVTIAIGDAYLRAFQESALPGWRVYAEKYGYDIVVLTEPLDANCDFSRKSIHWQKLLLGLHPQIREYRHAVWLDGDILINTALAPCIVSAMKSDRIGVVDITGPNRVPDEIFNLNARYLILALLLAKRLIPGMGKSLVTDTDMAVHYRDSGLTGDVDKMINTGVIVFRPEAHAKFLAGIYMKYDKDFEDFEQTPVSYELQKRSMVEFIDTRFNRIWAQVAAEHYPFLFDPSYLFGEREMLRLCVNVAFRNAWFLHFAGAKASPIIKGAFGLVDPGLGSIPEMVFPEFRERKDELMVFRRLGKEV